MDWKIPGWLANGGREAMLFDLLAMDLTGFDVRAIPQTEARTEQKRLSLRGVEGWLNDALATGRFKFAHGELEWADEGCEIGISAAYDSYRAYSNGQGEHHPHPQTVFGKELQKLVGPEMRVRRPGGSGPGGGRQGREYIFAPLDVCRARFACHLGDPNMRWGQGGED